MPQMMPLWWMMNLIYTTMIITFFILLIHYTQMTELSRSLVKMQSLKLKIKW